MDLLDSYIRTLRVFLPKNQRDDIARELSEEMRSHAADREAALGRPLNADEQAALLAQYGHPLLTATRYRPARHLIGPVLFPYYVLVLKLVLGLVLAGHTIGFIVLLGQDASLPQAGERVSALIQNVFAVIAWLTILAAVGDWWLTKSRVLERWDPKRLLPPLHEQAQRAVRPPMGAPASLSGFLVGLVLSAWWLLALRYPYLMFGPGAANLDWGPAMDRLYPVLVVAQLTMVVEHFARLTRPGATGVFRITRLVWAVAALLFLFVILTVDHQWIVWRETAAAATRTKVLFEVAGRQVTAIDIANYSFSIPFTLAAVGGTLSLIRRLFRWFSSGGRPAATAGAVLSAVIVPAAAAQIPGDAVIHRILADENAGVVAMPGGAER